MKINSDFVNKIMNGKKYILSIFCIFSLLITTWLGLFSNINYSASAQNLDIDSYSQTIAFGFNNRSSIKQKAKSDFDKVVGAGSSDKIEGKTEEALGNIEQNFGKVTGQAKGIAKQAEGRAKQDIGKTKSAAENFTSKVEEKTDDALSNMQNMLSN